MIRTPAPAASRRVNPGRAARGPGGALHIKGVLIAECNMHICTTLAMHTTICIIQMQAVAAILRLSLILRWNLHPWRSLMYAKDHERMAGGLCGSTAAGLRRAAREQGINQM